MINEIIIPDGIEKIDANVISINTPEGSKYTIEKIVLPSSIKKIENKAFYNYTALKEINVPEGVEEIGDEVFLRCNALEKIILPSTLKEIGKRVFNYTALKEINVPEGVEEIGDEVFLNCNALEKIILPSTLKRIGIKVFPVTHNKDTRLDIELSSGNKEFCYENGMLLSKDKFRLFYVNDTNISDELILPKELYLIKDYAAYQNSTVKKIVFQSNIYQFGVECFSSCSSLKEVIFNDNQIRIEDTHRDSMDQYTGGIFNNCHNLESIYLPKSLKKIGKNVFFNCALKNNIILPDELKEIETHAFSKNDIQNIILPKKITYVGSDAFGSSLKNVIVYDNAKLGKYAKEDLLLLNTKNSFNIIVKAAKNGKIKYILHISANMNYDDLQLFKSAWGRGINFNFCHIDEEFDKLRDKIPYLSERLYRSSENLDDLTAENMVKYLNKNIKKFIMYCIDENDIEKLKYFDKYKVIKKNNINDMIKYAQTKGNQEFVEYLTDYKENILQMTSNEISIPDGYVKIPENIFKTYNGIAMESSNQYINNVIRGLKPEIKKVELFLRSKSIFISDSDEEMIDDNIVQIRLGYCDYIPTIAKNFPAIKATGLMQSVNKYFQDIIKIWISECGYTNISKIKESVYYDPWAECINEEEEPFYIDMFKSCKTQFIDLRSGEYVRGYYYYCFNTEWDKNDYLLEIDGSFYGHLNVENEEFKIDNGTLKKYNGMGGIVDIPEGVKELDYSEGLRKNAHITSVKIPSSLKVIKEFTFNECISLEKIILSEGVMGIDKYAFSQCSNLTHIEVPSTLKYIAIGAFGKCDKLSISLEDLPNGIESVDISILKDYSHFEGILTNANKTSVLHYKLDESDKEITIPEGIVTIGEQIFRDNNIVEVIHLSSTVSKMYPSVFANCYNLKEINIPEGITEIPEYAFLNCVKLERITIPSSIKRIDNHAFMYCKSLKHIEMQEGIEFIGDSAFYDCENLLLDKFPNTVKSIENSVLNQGVFKNCKKLKEFTIPKGITHVPSSMFIDCINLEKVVLPNTVKAIGKGAFRNCKKLNTINLPDSLEIINDEAFINCEILEDINLPNTLNYIGDKCFYECNKIDSVAIPGSVEQVSKSAFEGCINLKKVIIEDGVKAIMNKSFANCDSLETIVIKGTLKKKPSKQILSKTNSVTVYGIPGTKAEDLASTNNAKFIDLKDSHIDLEDTQEKAVETQPLSGLTFVVTGDLVHFPESGPYPQRKKLKQLITAKGGRLVGSVSGKTDYLICNNSMSGTTKVKEAKARGVKIISEEEFLSMVK